MPTVELIHVSKTYGRGNKAVDDVSLSIQRRRVPGAGRALGLRQVHRAAHDRRARGGHRGAGQDRRPRGQRRGAQGPGHRHGVPELRALPAHVGLRQHGLRPAPAQARAPTRWTARCAGRPGRWGSTTYLAAQAARALGRRAAARRARARHGARPAGLPVRRAALEPRRQAARADARRDQAPAPARERHHGLRDARPDRGDDAGRPHRGPAQGAAPAGGGPVHALRAPGEPVRGRLHRQPADQLLLRHARRRRHDARERGHGHPVAGRRGRARSRRGGAAA